MTKAKSLEKAVEEHPFDDYGAWWPVGSDFLAAMSTAMVAEWRTLTGDASNLRPVQEHVDRYVTVVYGHSADPELVAAFQAQRWTRTFMSGEFDALSYAYFRHAFDLIAAAHAHNPARVARARRLFTKQVGRRFFRRIEAHCSLRLPSDLGSHAELMQLTAAINEIGLFLRTQGYLRDHFAFRFDVSTEHHGTQIVQRTEDVTASLAAGRTAYALYEMGYPIILPSAVYLYQTVGEAQHHSSRTIEELFDRIGYRARETDDFDPADYPSELVVELWTIDPLCNQVR